MHSAHGNDKDILRKQSLTWGTALRPPYRDGKALGEGAVGTGGMRHAFCFYATLQTFTKSGANDVAVHCTRSQFRVSSLKTRERFGCKEEDQPLL